MLIFTALILDINLYSKLLFLFSLLLPVKSAFLMFPFSTTMMFTCECNTQVALSTCPCYSIIWPLHAVGCQMKMIH